MTSSVSSLTVNVAMAQLQAVRALTGTSTGNTPSEASPSSDLMSVINQREASYEAEFSILSQMKSQMAQLSDVTQAQLGPVTTDMSNEEIKSRLKAFATAYNQWDSNFDKFVAPGGQLEDNQAATMIRFAIYRDVDNPFSGADHGVQGLRSIGVDTDAGRQIVFDDAKLDAALASNKAGVVAAINQFSSTLQDTISVWGSSHHVLDNRLHRLADAVNFVETQRSALEAEFGAGATATAQGYSQNYSSGASEMAKTMSALAAYGNVAKL